jgi:carbon-monoxide dehydrogenase large subunit
MTYSYGVHLAHVAVDAETGMMEVLKYLVVEDVGRAINPLMVHGQTVGSAVQDRRHDVGELITMTTDNC